MPTIFSTLSNDRTFPLYADPAKGSQVSKRTYKSSILVKGGANVANKHGQTKGVTETEVTADELKMLQANPSFQRLEKRGFLSTKRPTEPKRDGAAPKTEAELKAKSGKKGVDVVLNTEEPEL